MKFLSGTAVRTTKVHKTETKMFVQVVAKTTTAAKAQLISCNMSSAIVVCMKPAQNSRSVIYVENSGVANEIKNRNHFSKFYYQIF